MIDSPTERKEGLVKRVVCLILLALTVLALTLASCTSAATTTSPATTGATSPPPTTGPVATTSSGPEKPQYGGTLILPLNADITTFDTWSMFPAVPVDLAFERLWDGDWAKGPAGGYGTNQAEWTASVNIRELRTGYLAESINWAPDADGKTVTAVIKVRQGIHFGLTKTEAGKLVNGRELTADDVEFNLTARMTDSRAMAFLFSPFMRTLKATKTGPWEVSVTLPTADFPNGILRLLDGTLLFAPEVLKKYGNDMSYWQNAVGTGAYLITDYVAGSEVIDDRNPNYWLKDPVGPGKGNQLPYVDRVKFLIIPDISTREAALRTAKIDQLPWFTPEAAEQMMKQVPALKQATGGWGAEPHLFMRTDKAPFNDVRVRRAFLLATDFNAINKAFYSGQAQILSWPYWKAKEYAPIYLGLDDPAMPATVKELYTYNPDQARQLLKDAGFPNGLKAELLLQNVTTTVDLYSSIKDMWSKAGIEITLSPKEFNALNNILDRFAYDQMVAAIAPPNGSWPQASGLMGKTRNNPSMIDDKKVTDAVIHWNLTFITDVPAAMAETKELVKYVLDQAWAVPAPRYPQYNLWWPWLKNYSGETTVGWIGGFWPRYVWIDQQLKTSLGY